MPREKAIITSIYYQKTIIAVRLNKEGRNSSVLTYKVRSCSSHILNLN